MNIKSFIIERGLSVKQVADNMGISSPALSQLLSGNPTVQKIQDIAERASAASVGSCSPTKWT